MSQEYIAALAIVIVGVLKLFKVDIGTAEVSQILTAGLGIWIMIRRYQRGDITLTGIRK